MKKPIVILVVMGVLLLFTTMIFAASESSPVNQDGFVADAEEPPSPVADMKMDATQIIWASHVENAGLVLTISGPDDLYFRQEFASGVELTLGLLDDAGMVLPDGSYNYELYAIPVLSQAAERAMSADREGGDAGLMSETDSVAAVESLTQSGHFRVDGGMFVLPMVTESVTANTDAEAVNAVDGSFAPQDQVILDDLIVDGSACIGFDCVNGESFGFDTLRLKENNLRISFVDTSSSASFPSNDWQITANDSSNGGANKFSIDDISGGRTPFTIEASAPSHSLYVDSAGRIGIGTSNPVVEIHSKDGDTPTLRLEQDGSSGFGAQTWDVAGNETNFFIRDATNGSTLPFRIRPGAASNSIYIDTDSEVGIGTSSPSARLDVAGDAEINGPLTVTKDDGTAAILVNETSSTAAWRTLMHLTNNGPTAIKVEDSGSGDNWTMGLDSGGNGFFEINYNGGDPELLLSKGGNLFISGSLTSSAAVKQTMLMVEQQKQIEDLEARLVELELLVEALSKR